MEPARLEAEQEMRREDPEGSAMLIKAQRQLLTYNRRVDDLAYNWQRFLLLSSGALCVAIVYYFFSRSDLSWGALLAYKLAALTAVCSGVFAQGTHRAVAKGAALVLIGLQAALHQVLHLHGDW